MKKLLVNFAKDNSGATAIEYALIASGVSLAILTVVTTLGSNLNSRFQSIADALAPTP